jgi:hypothetical protein
MQRRNEGWKGRMERRNEGWTKEEKGGGCETAAVNNKYAKIKRRRKNPI